MASPQGFAVDSELDISKNDLLRKAPKHGEIIEPFNDGRRFRYCENGGTALTRGKLVSTADAVANHNKQAIGDNVAVDATLISIDLGGTLMTVNQYAGGYIHIVDGAGQGSSYRVKNHAAAALNASSVEIHIYGKVNVALTTATSKYTLIPHPCDGVQVAVADGLDALVGVTGINVSASYGFWAQVAGVCTILANGAIKRGAPVMLSGIAGSVSSITGNDVHVESSGESKIVGEALIATADTDYVPVLLNQLPGS